MTPSKIDSPAATTGPEKAVATVASRVDELERGPSLPLGAGFLMRATRLAADWVTAFAVLCATHLVLRALGATGAARPDLAFALATILCVVLVSLGAYRALEGPCHVEAVTAVVDGSALAMVGLLVVSLVFVGGSPPLVLVLVDLPVLVLALVALRVFLGPIEHWISSTDLTPVVVYGAGATGRLLAQKLTQDDGLGFRPVGFVDDDGRLSRTAVRVGEGEQGARLPVLGRGAELAAVLERTGAGAVFTIAIPSLSSERIAAIVDGLESPRRPVYFVPSSGDQPFASLRVTTVGGIPVLSRRRPLRHAVYDLVKRLLDIVGSFGLIVAAAPALLVAALLVRLTSPGPMLFRQTRVGFRGRPFTICKLRTMRADTDAYAFHPESTSDGRVTRVGRWLRRLSLDELPQLYNILRGDMSFVGPRPEMPFIVATYNDTQLQRLMVKPGLTGLWQVSPDRAFRIHDNIHYDLYYVENRSLAMDFAILVLTPFMLLSQHAAK